MLDHTLTQSIASAMRGADMDVRTLARTLGESDDTVTAWLTNPLSIPLESFAEMSAALGVRPSALSR